MPAARPNKGLLTQEPSETHKAFASYIEKTTGHTVPVGDVALVQRLYPKFLKSPAVVKAREAEKEAKEKAEQEKADRKAAALRDRLAKAEEQAARLRRELGIDNDDQFVPLAEVTSMHVVSPAKVVEPEDAVAEEAIEVMAEVVETGEAAAEEPVSEVPAIVLGEASDEFVEPSTSDDDEWEDF